MADRTRTTKPEWILLIHQLPPKPTNLRVRIWRKLQKLGAVAIKNSVYVLPATEKAHEDFQWLKQEIESAGGEASAFNAASVESDYWAWDHTHNASMGYPLLVLDMYEHAYHMDYGAAAAKYVDAFMLNVNWDEVNRRVEAIGSRK